MVQMAGFTTYPVNVLSNFRIDVYNSLAFQFIINFSMNVG